jgi:probable HAF family extracellular repeat protein
MPPGTLSSRAQDINDAGWITGYASVSGFPGPDVAFLFNGETSLLGTLPGGNYSVAEAVNSKGQVAGYWGHNVTGQPPQAFVWQNAIMRSLTDDLGWPKSRGFDINDFGWVTGVMATSFVEDARAFIWRDGEVLDLGPIPGGYTSEGQAINDRGDVAGGGVVPYGASSKSRAFFYADGVAMNLGALPGYLRSHAYDVNNDRIVVGYCSDSDRQADSAFVWKDGVMWNLNDVVVDDLTHVFVLKSATAINELGEILAYAAGQVLVVLSPAPLIGDLNCDGAVGLIDLLRLLAAWSECESCDEDLNGDGTVDLFDLMLMLANWG